MKTTAKQIVLTDTIKKHWAAYWERRPGVELPPIEQYLANLQKMTSEEAKELQLRPTQDATRYTHELIDTHFFMGVEHPHEIVFVGMFKKKPRILKDK